ncbi:MAG: alanine--glyoxylate aminotransferase family protein, partial [Zetaproteobacteria bacterium]
MPTLVVEELNPPPRLLMGPGPVDADPRVLRAMAMPLLGQFDPAFTRYMNETMGLYRGVFETRNRWTMVVDGSARAGIEAVLVSAIRPGDRVLVPIFGRFGHLLAEIAERCRAEVRTLEAPWGTVFPPDRIEEAVRSSRPRLVAIVHGDTSTTIAQPLAEIGAICRRADALLYVDATATLGGMEFATDAWQIDAVSAGLQKCLGGPPGVAPVTVNDRMAEVVNRRKHVERGIRDPGGDEVAEPRIQSNYFDLPMLMDYWSERRLNHHTEATSMLYAARECARILLEEGLTASQARHRLASEALTAGLAAMGLELFGDQRHKMANVTGVAIPAGVDGEAVRARLLEDFGIEIGTSFGPLRGKVWRIGTMGFACRKQNVLRCLGALEAVLRSVGYAGTS